MILAVINTYNRPQGLARIVKQIRPQVNDIIVFDDCGPIVKPRRRYHPYTLFRAKRNHGRIYFWAWMDNVFRTIEDRYQDYDYYLFLQDDVQAHPDSVKECIRLWESIKDKKKLTLNPTNCGREKDNHLKFTRYEYNDELYRSWGIDGMAWFCTKKYLELLDYKVHPIASARLRNAYSSGVFGQLSLRGHEAGGHYYQVIDTLFHHGDLPSQMNPRDRNLIPLKY